MNKYHGSIIYYFSDVIDFLLIKNEVANNDM